MAKEKRFVMVDTQSSFANEYREVVDTTTGVHYLIWQNGYAGGVTPLLGADGKPVISARGEIPET